jgi:hypothetical protein
MWGRCFRMLLPHSTIPGTAKLRAQNSLVFEEDRMDSIRSAKTRKKESWSGGVENSSSTSKDASR